MPQFRMPLSIQSIRPSSITQPARSNGRSRALVRGGAMVLAAGTLVLVSGAAAQAHVQVIPDQTAAGSESTKLTFRVPTESETASTTRVSVSLPTDTPLAEVLVEPIAGWTVAVKEAKLPKPVVLDGTTLTEAPSTVTWTATRGHGVPPGGFGEFVIAAGPIPDDAKVLSFPTIQTYSDNSVVKWNQPQAAGADEPEDPLPSFTVTAAAPEEGHAAEASPAATDTSGVSASPVEAGSVLTEPASSDGVGRGLGAAGLVAGLLGLAFGVLAWRKAGAASTAPATPVVTPSSQTGSNA
jgi:uncharacterized protein YcnI